MLDRYTPPSPPLLLCIHSARRTVETAGGLRKREREREAAVTLQKVKLRRVVPATQPRADSEAISERASLGGARRSQSQVIRRERRTQEESDCLTCRSYKLSRTPAGAWCWLEQTLLFSRSSVPLFLFSTPLFSRRRDVMNVFSCSGSHW